MADYTITLTAEEEIVYSSFYETTSTSLQNKVRRHTKALAKRIIEESTSQLDPDKLSVAELRAEIVRLDGLGEIPTYAERYPTV